VARFGISVLPSQPTGVSRRELEYLSPLEIVIDSHYSSYYSSQREFHRPGGGGGEMSIGFNVPLHSSRLLYPISIKFSIMLKSCLRIGARISKELSI
jgi:hypothetical protein